MSPPRATSTSKDTLGIGCLHHRGERATRLLSGRTFPPTPQGHRILAGEGVLEVVGQQDALNASAIGTGTCPEHGPHGVASGTIVRAMAIPAAGLSFHRT